MIDVGIAGLLVFAGRETPERLTVEDVVGFNDWAEEHYVLGDLRTTVDMLFTNNFLHRSKGVQELRSRVREALGAVLEEGNSALPPCGFCGRMAGGVLHRDGVPMLRGQNTVNFYPGGLPGLSVCGLCRLALNGLSLSAPRCSGKVLVLHADTPRLQKELVSGWVERVRKEAQLSAQAGPAFKAARTRVIEALLRVQRQAETGEQATGLVAYHISNSGQGPGIEIYPLPSAVVRFVRRAMAQRYRDAWSAIERRAWQRTSKKGPSAAEVTDEERVEYQNYLYEDLFRLPEDSGRFIRLYFLRNATGLVRRRDDDPRSDYRTAREADVINWDLCELFLKEVLGMEQARVAAIRDLGDRLADEIVSNTDRRLLRTAYMARDYRTIRRLLLQADLRTLTRAPTPLLTLDDYLLVFEEGTELARADWRLAWDLVLIRVIEQLHQRGQAEIITAAVDAAELDEDEAGDQRDSA